MANLVSSNFAKAKRSSWFPLTAILVAMFLSLGSLSNKVKNHRTKYCLNEV
jgi:hypothetical protein